MAAPVVPITGFGNVAFNTAGPDCLRVSLLSRPAHDFRGEAARSSAEVSGCSRLQNGRIVKDRAEGSSIQISHCLCDGHRSALRTRTQSRLDAGYIVLETSVIAR